MDSQSAWGDSEEGVFQGRDWAWTWKIISVVPGSTDVSLVLALDRKSGKGRISRRSCTVSVEEVRLDLPL